MAALSVTVPPMNRQAHSLLCEAARRYLCFNPENRPLTEAWTGLGSMTTYRTVLDAGLMTWVDSAPTARCGGWLKLTPQGANAVRQMIRAQLCGGANGYETPQLPSY
jgi:hypothetical protein